MLSAVFAMTSVVTVGASLASSLRASTTRLGFLVSMSSVMVLFWCLMKVFCCSTTACMESSLDFAALRSDFVALRSLSAASVSSTHSWASAEGREASSLDRLALGGADAGAARGLLWGLGLPGIGGGGRGGSGGGGGDLLMRWPEEA